MAMYIGAERALIVTCVGGTLSADSSDHIVVVNEVVGAVDKEHLEWHLFLT